MICWVRHVKYPHLEPGGLWHDTEGEPRFTAKLPCRPLRRDCEPGLSTLCTWFPKEIMHDCPFKLCDKCLESNGLAIVTFRSHPYLNSYCKSPSSGQSAHASTKAWWVLVIAKRSWMQSFSKMHLYNLSLLLFSTLSSIGLDTIHSHLITAPIFTPFEWQILNGDLTGLSHIPRLLLVHRDYMRYHIKSSHKGPVRLKAGVQQ